MLLLELVQKLVGITVVYIVGVGIVVRITVVNIIGNFFAGLLFFQSGLLQLGLMANSVIFCTARNLNAKSDGLGTKY